MIHTQDADFTLHLGDCIEVLADLPDMSVDAVVTSPPYLDARPEYDTFSNYFDLFRQFDRVVRGPALFNVGRIFRNGEEQLWWLTIINSSRAHGWLLLDTLIWIRPNSNPIQGQVFTNAHEYVLVFGRKGAVLNIDSVRAPYADSSVSRMNRKYLNGGGVKGEVRPQEGRDANPLGARPRSYIEIYVGAEKGNKHPAPMPAALAEHLVSLATFPGETILDPFAGSGTTAIAARKLGRSCVAIEKREDYANDCARRLGQQSLLAELA